MARMFKAKRGRSSADSQARPGAARVLPMRLISRVPGLGRLVRTPPTPKKPALLSPRRLASLLRRWKPVPPPKRLHIPFVAPMIRGVRQPIQRTAAAVRVARDVRKPRTRWERLREAARMAMDDPADGRRWERLMGLGVGLVAGSRQPQRSEPPAKRPPRSRGARPKLDETVMHSEPWLRARLQRLQMLLNENAGPAQSRDRRGIDKNPKKTR